MEIELSGTVRGETAVVRWCDGTMRGNEAILARVQPMVAEGRCDPFDLTSVIRAVELAAGQRMRLRVVESAEPGTDHARAEAKASAA